MIDNYNSIKESPKNDKSDNKKKEKSQFFKMKDEEFDEENSI